MRPGKNIMNRIPYKILGFAALLALALGCASPNLHVTRLSSGSAVSMEKPLKVYELGTGKPAQKAGAIARKHARLLLAKKGYCAALADDKLAPGFPDGPASLNAADRMKYGLASGGIAPLFVPSAKTVRSVHAALVKAFETLPDLSSPPAPK
jgi:hypothetical protein